MSGLKSGLVAVAFAVSCGVFAVVGCSADGTGTGPLDETTPTEPEPGAVLPEPGSSGSSGTPEEDSGKPKPKDAGAKDSTVDAGPPPPVPGTACTTVDEVRKKTCGACGSQSTICLSDKKWSVYSGCEGELAGGCIPGTIVNEACGNCGTVKKTCSQYCAFTSTACTGSPAGACVPGGVDLSSAGCTVMDTFRQRSCGAACTYGSFGAACEAPPTTVEIGPTTGSVTSTVAILTATPVLSRLTGSCPGATLSTTISTPYTYIQVHNPLAKAATVSIYNSLPTGGVAYKTILAQYDGNIEPIDDTTRKACVKTASYGTLALTGDYKYASLDGTYKQVTVAAGATVSILIQAYNAYDPLKPAESTGKVKLNVQTVSLQ
jgi:hypothetical protein